MTYVITTLCIGSKDASCVEVCPVDAIHPAPEDEAFEAVEQLFIDPRLCIDCDACRTVCPMEAIYTKATVPPDQAASVRENAAFYT
ncbi:4Fe-4S dicluster domain-containing protein [Aquabacter spiritensis]|uniref:Ferredoxin n=1 Tax=Aquabacter spiritensis TaxID=933073 RepID=A0A4R3LVY0_9HYPH|nr:4Fe-4S binding protein [Aquabacter spiritensis]TCT03859.1 4Fe-4S dicluster protein [Aquabacter spiritensis]